MQQAVIFKDLGRMSYQPAWDYQEKLLRENTDIKFKARQEGRDQLPQELPTKHYLLFVEHPPVFTLGKNGQENHIIWDESVRRERGVEYFHINRGGDITFHGPEQLVGYPILDLEKFKADLGWYLRSLEEVIIATMSDYGLKGDRSPGETGVWIDPDIKGRERKICAMGIKCSRWVTMHGFAFNVNTDLSYFSGIVPCGIENKQVTSLEKELGRKIPMEEVKQHVKKNFESVFNCRLAAEIASVTG